MYEMYELLAFEIQSCQRMMAEAMLRKAPNLLRRDALAVDMHVRNLLRLVGTGTVRGVYQGLAALVTAEAQEETGLPVERRKKITFDTLFGSIEVESPYLWDRVTKESARPVKKELGLRGRMRTPALERALTDFGAEQSGARASSRFEEHYGFKVERTAVLRVVHKHAQRAEGLVAERLEHSKGDFDTPVAERPGVDVILAEMDGSELRTGILVPLEVHEGEAVPTTPIRKLPRRRREENWRDVRLGLVAPMDEEEPTYVARLGPYDDVVELMVGAACLRGLSRRTMTVAVGDGGNGLMEAMERGFEPIQYILDRPHCVSHICDTANEMGLKGEERDGQVDCWMDTMETGNIEELLDELAGFQEDWLGKERVGQLEKHLKRFQHCVHYQAYRDLGYPVGSGEIESGHRSVIQPRMKLPGTWWHPANVNPMLALRTVRANGWWDDLWRMAS